MQHGNVFVNSFANDCLSGVAKHAVETYYRLLGAGLATPGSQVRHGSGHTAFASSLSGSVCVRERVVAGSQSCVDALGLSALVATDRKMYLPSLCDVLCRGAWLACTCNKEWMFPADDVNSQQCWSSLSV